MTSISGPYAYVSFARENLEFRHLVAQFHSFSPLSSCHALSWSVYDVEGPFYESPLGNEVQNFYLVFDRLTPEIKDLWYRMHSGVWGIDPGQSIDHHEQVFKEMVSRNVYQVIEYLKVHVTWGLYVEQISPNLSNPDAYARILNEVASWPEPYQTIFTNMMRRSLSCPTHGVPQGDLSVLTGIFLQNPVVSDYVIHSIFKASIDGQKAAFA